jgi:hypothetical protein
MEIKHGDGTALDGPGVEINLTGDEVAIAIRSWLIAKEIFTVGPITIRVNGELCRSGRVFVDPSGYVIVEDRHTVFGHGLDRPKLTGYCSAGICVCGSDLPRVRAGCANWRTE